MTDSSTIEIQHIIEKKDIQIRARVSQETVQRYADSIEYLPAIDVFATATDEGERYILADGFHRLAAFRFAGRTEIRATVHIGDDKAIAEFAAVANATSGLPLTIPERNTAIRRVHKLQPELKQKDVGQLLGVSQPVVSLVYRIDAARRKHGESTVGLSDAHMSDILRITDTDAQKLVVEAAAEHDWTRNQTRDATDFIRSDNISEHEKSELLSGTIKPVKVDKVGRYKREIIEVETLADKFLTALVDLDAAAANIDIAEAVEIILAENGVGVLERASKFLLETFVMGGEVTSDEIETNDAIPGEEETS